MINVGEGEGADKILPSGMSLNQLKELQHQQNSGTQPMVDAVNDIIVTGEPQHAEVEKFAKDYKVPLVEYLTSWHIILQNKLHNQETGERIDAGGNIQRYSLAAYKQAERLGGVRAKKATIVHNPIAAAKLVREADAAADDYSDTIKQKPSKNQNDALKNALEKVKSEALDEAELIMKQAQKVATEKDDEIAKLKEALKIASIPEEAKEPEADNESKNSPAIEGEVEEDLDVFLDQKEKDLLAENQSTKGPKTPKASKGKTTNQKGE